MKLLIIGSAGQVGRALTELAAAEQIDFEASASADLDITRANRVQRAVRRARADYVVNAAAYTAVDAAEDHAEEAFAVNSSGVQNIAKACQRAGIPLIHISTDYVFDGEKAAGYTEQDEANPLNVYGKSKLSGENAVRETLDHHIILRVSWVFSERGNNFVKTMVRLGVEKPELKVVADQVGGPTPAADIARVILAILRQLDCGAGNWGTYHYSGRAATSWYDFARSIVAEAGKHTQSTVEKWTRVATADYGFRAKRPLNSRLNCQKILEDFGIKQRPWQPEMERVVASCLEPEDQRV